MLTQIDFAPCVPLLCAVTVPELVLLTVQGLCKLGSFGGDDASAKSFADGSNEQLAKACRKFVTVNINIYIFNSIDICKNVPLF